MSKIVVYSSQGFRGEETVITIPDSPGLVLRGSGEELSAAVESLAADFYRLFGTGDEFDITERLLRIYAQSRKLCELLAAQEVLMDSAFRFVMVEEQTGFIHLASELALGPYVEIGDMHFPDPFSAHHRPHQRFYESLELLRAGPLTRLLRLPRALVALVGQLCADLSRLSSTQGWEAMQIQLLRIYGRSRQLIRALAGSRFGIDGFPFAYFTDQGEIAISAHFQKSMAAQEAKYIGRPTGSTIH